MAVPITAKLGAMTEFEERRRRIPQDNVVYRQDAVLNSLPPPPRARRKIKSKEFALTPKTDHRDTTPWTSTSLLDKPSSSTSQQSIEPLAEKSASSYEQGSDDLFNYVLPEIGEPSESSFMDDIQSSFPITVMDSSFRPLLMSQSNISKGTETNRFTAIGPKDELPAEPKSVKKSILKSPLQIFSIGQASDSSSNPDEGMQTLPQSPVLVADQSDISRRSDGSLETKKSKSRSRRPSANPEPYDWLLDSPTPPSSPSRFTMSKTAPEDKLEYENMKKSTTIDRKDSFVDMSYPRTPFTVRNSDSSDIGTHLYNCPLYALPLLTTELLKQHGLPSQSVGDDTSIYSQESSSDFALTSTHQVGDEQSAQNTRKLAQLTGESPRVIERRASINNLGRVSPLSWDIPDGTVYLSGNGRRQTVPLAPETASFLHGSDTASVLTIMEFRRQSKITLDRLPIDDDAQPTSPSSFIDLSDEDEPINYSHLLRQEINNPVPRSTTSALSSYEHLPPEPQSERYHKGDKLAKLHRLLGSHKSYDLPFRKDSSASWTTSDNNSASLLVPKYNITTDMENGIQSKMSGRKFSLPTSPTNEMEHSRLKEDLPEKEKAQNVRRAQKMEKVFGAQPPQALYHTRQLPAATPSKDQTQPIKASPWSPLDINSSSETPGRNKNQYAYTKIKKARRPGTSSGAYGISHSIVNESMQLWREPDIASRSTTERKEWQTWQGVYSHYQHSLNSLHDIIQRDDVESLMQLQQCLMEPPQQQQQQLKESSYDVEDKKSGTSTTKSSRRRSLPMSIMSGFSVGSEETSEFELRRRKAAKLTNFFGVDYRLLIEDVLDSIERGVNDDTQLGTLKPAEAEDLLQRLRALKVTRAALTP